jgi:hypothetical protein
MKIPNSVIYVVGDVLGSWYYSHSKLNTLFGGCGFPGDPPDGNCVDKCQEWMRRANQTSGIIPLDLLGDVLVEFMNFDRDADQKWLHGRDQVIKVLTKNNLAIDFNGVISSTTSRDTLSPLPSMKPVQPQPASQFVQPPMSEITVFLSYSHDSDFHRERVLDLSERLRADGIATILDRYVEKGSPPEGWPSWMMNGLNAATHIVCVCTETYRRRFLGQEVLGKGKGVDWEGALVTQALYDARSRTNRFIPVLFIPADEPHIPEPLRPQTHYVLDSEASYQAFYDALLDQAGVTPGAVGTLKHKPRPASL